MPRDAAHPGRSAGERDDERLARRAAIHAQHVKLGAQVAGANRARAVVSARRCLLCPLRLADRSRAVVSARRLLLLLCPLGALGALALKAVAARWSSAQRAQVAPEATDVEGVLLRARDVDRRRRKARRLQQRLDVGLVHLVRHALVRPEGFQGRRQTWCRCAASKVASGHD